MEIMGNSMMCIEVYRHCGTWAFTDKERDLVHEPFVAGIPEIIDLFVDNYGDKTRETHRITFSDQSFPGSHAYLTKTRNEMNGAWYQFGDYEGWLCPATLKYFPWHPQEVHVAID